MAALENKKTRMRRGMLREAGRRALEEARTRARHSMALRTAATVAHYSRGTLASGGRPSIHTTRGSRPPHPMTHLLPAARHALNGSRAARALTMAGKPGHHGTALRLATRPADLVKSFLTRSTPMSRSAMAALGAPKGAAAETRVNRLRREMAQANNNRASPRRVKSLNRNTKRKTKTKKSA